LGGNGRDRFRFLFGEQPADTEWRRNWCGDRFPGAGSGRYNLFFESSAMKSWEPLIFIGIGVALIWWVLDNQVTQEDVLSTATTGQLVGQIETNAGNAIENSYDSFAQNNPGFSNFLNEVSEYLPDYPD
jgi:hypothetical protein